MLRIDWIKLLEPYNLTGDEIERITHYAAAYIENEKIFKKHNLQHDMELKIDIMWNFIKVLDLIKLYEFKKEAFFLSINALQYLIDSLKELKILVKQGASKEELQREIDSMDLDQYCIEVDIDGFFQ